MSLRVVRAGAFDTIQDLGRIGYRAWGVPWGGAADRGAFQLANALLANPPGAPALELALVGGTYEALAPLAVALAGADMPASLEGPGGLTTLHPPFAASMEAGSRIRIGPARVGMRAYLAVRGGFLAPTVLGSTSAESRLAAGTILEARPASTPTRGLRPEPHPDGEPGVLRVLPGPDAERLLQPIASGDFEVDPRSDRMGLRLEGELPVRPDPDRLSAPVAPGAVQVAGGRAIVLGVAGGTMGGYPHVAQVIAADLDRLGQLRPGDSVRFLLVDLAEARRLDRARRAALAGRDLLVSALAADGLRWLD